MKIEKLIVFLISTISQNHLVSTIPVLNVPLFINSILTKFRGKQLILHHIKRLKKCHTLKTL